MLPPLAKFDWNVWGLWSHQQGQHANPAAWLHPLESKPNNQGLQTRGHNATWCYQSLKGLHMLHINMGWDKTKTEPCGTPLVRSLMAKMPFTIAALWVQLPKRTSDLFTELSRAPRANVCLQWNSCGPWWTVMKSSGSNLTFPVCERKAWAFSSMGKKKPLLNMTKLCFPKSQPGALQPARQGDRGLMSRRGLADTPAAAEKWPA